MSAQNSTLPNLVVRTIIETKDAFSQVVVSREVFEATKGYVPPMPYTTAQNAAGQGIRVFEFAGGHKLYVRYVKDDAERGNYTVFVTDADTAQATLTTLEQEREGGEKVGFSF